MTEIRNLLGRLTTAAVGRASRGVNAARRLWARVTGAPAPPLRTVRADEVPETVEADRLYVVGEGAYEWYVVFTCPCGCGETIHLSLIEGDKPRWRLTDHGDDTVSVSPSVWRRRGCRSHFFVRRGRIDWCSSGIPRRT